VSSCTVVSDASGSGYVVGDILQIVGGFPEKQTGSLEVVTVTVTGGHVATVKTNGNFAFTMKPPSDTVSTTFVRGTGSVTQSNTATFTIVWKTNNSGCCSCS
jgi:hypothetical protein